MSSLSLPNPAPDWIDGRMWSEITALSTLPMFANLAQDVRLFKILNKNSNVLLCFELGSFIVFIYYLLFNLVYFI